MNPILRASLCYSPLLQIGNAVYLWKRGSIYWFRRAIPAAPILLADGSRDLYFQPERFKAQYAADLSESETKLLALTQRPMAERAMTEVSQVLAWKTIPSWFIFGTRD